MKCTNCGYGKLTAQFYVCPKCGTLSGPAMDGVAVVRCSNCEAFVPDHQTKCMWCGRRRTVQPAAGSESAHPAAQRAAPTLKSVYRNGALLGIPAVVLAPAPPIQLGLSFAVLGLVLGFLRPVGRWHWGVALAIPLVALGALSGAFAGGANLRVFLSQDVSRLVGVIAGGTLGGQLGAWLRCRLDARRRRNS